MPRETADSPGRPEALARLTHRRWALPVLAELAAGGGCKLVWLERHVGAGRGPAKDAVSHLIELDLAKPNPGYGHPLRPEYVPTEAGRAAGETAGRVLGLLEKHAAVEAGARADVVAPTVDRHGVASLDEASA